MNEKINQDAPVETNWRPIIWGLATLLILIFVIKPWPGGEGEEEAGPEVAFSGPVLTSTNWQEQVDKSDLPVLVDFWAPWCPPCKKLGPTIAALAQEKAGKAVVGKCNTDDPESQAISQKLQISALPTVILFHKGKEVARLQGLRGKKEYEKLLAQAPPG